MINKFLLDAFKTDQVNWFKKHDYSIDSLCANPYRGQISFIACYHGDKNIPTQDISTGLYILNFNRSNRYGIHLPNQYVKADKHIEKPCPTANFYEVLYSNISIYEAPPFMFQDIAIHYKPYFINECAYAFEQFLLWDYHKGPQIKSIDNKNNLLTFVIDSDLEPITNYFTVTNLPMAPNLEFTFKRIDKIEHHGNPSNLRCTYKLTNVRTTIFDNNCVGSCDVEFVKDPVKVTVKYKGQTYDVINNYESKSVRSFDLRATENDTDPVNHPNHYEMVGPFESFDIIVESLGIDGARQFCQGNIIKYQTRYREKNGEEDLKKRHWYSRMDQMLAKCKTIEDYYKLKESDF
nr:MAG TPA: nucelotide kinase [Bacteriophage sp.]